MLVFGTGGAEPGVATNPKISWPSSAPLEAPAGGGELYQEGGSSISVSMATFLFSPPPPFFGVYKWSIKAS